MEALDRSRWVDRRGGRLNDRQRPLIAQRSSNVSHSSLRRLVTTTTVVLTAGLALAACGASDEPSPTTSAQPGAPQVKLVQSGKLKTCTSLPYSPFQFDEGGKVV